MCKKVDKGGLWGGSVQPGRSFVPACVCVRACVRACGYGYGCGYGCARVVQARAEATKRLRFAERNLKLARDAASAARRRG